MAKPGSYPYITIDDAEESSSLFDNKRTAPPGPIVRHGSHGSHDALGAPQEKGVDVYERREPLRINPPPPPPPPPPRSGHNRVRSRERVSDRERRAERYYYYRDVSPVRPDKDSKKSPAAAPAPPPIIINNHMLHYASSDDERSSREKRNSRRQKNRDKRNASNDTDQPKATSQSAHVANPSDAQLVLAQRKVNAIWEPSQESDITIHLKLPIQADIDELLEEFCRLRVLGNFTAARQFFVDHLKEYQSNPYVLVQYAEMLLEQGDFNGFSDLERTSLFSCSDEVLDNEDEKFLSKYWKLMQAERACSKPPASDEIFQIIPEALESLQHMISLNPESIGSTQVQMLSTLLGMSASQQSHSSLQRGWLKRQLENLFPDTFYRSLYLQLLRQGRIWDFRVLFLSKSTADGCRAAIQAFSGRIDEPRPLSAIVSDWNANGSGSDTLTTLSMIDILTTVAVSKDEVVEDAMSMATSLAHTVLKLDEEGMQSETFLYWLLMRTCSVMNKDKSRAEDFHEYLISQPGMYFACPLGLPEYVPVSKENPGWRQHDASQQYLGPVRMVLDVAKRFGMYRLQAEALNVLINESSHPAKEFDELCNLQKTAQGDMKSYTHTLVSKYLTLSDDASSSEFRAELRKLCFDQTLRACLNPQELWVMCLLLYSMEDDGPDAEQALESAFKYSKYLEGEELDLFYRKMDHLTSKRARYLSQHSDSPLERGRSGLHFWPSESERRAWDVDEWPEILPITTKGENTTEATTRLVRPNTTQKTVIRHFYSSDDRSPSRERQTDHSQNQRVRTIQRSKSRRTTDYDYELERKRVDYELESKRTEWELERMRRELETLKTTESARSAHIRALSDNQEKKDDLRAHMQKESSRITKERDDLERELRDRMEQEKLREVERAQAEREERLKLEREAIRRQETSERKLEDLMSHLLKVQDDIQAIKSQAAAEEESPWIRFSEPPPPAPEPVPYGPEIIQRIKRARIPPRIIQIDHPSSDEDSYGTADEQSGPTHMPVSDMEENDDSTSGDDEENHQPFIDEPDNSSDDDVASADHRETNGQTNGQIIPEKSLSEGYDENEDVGEIDNEHDTTEDARDEENDSADELGSKPGINKPGDPQPLILHDVFGQESYEV